MSYAWDILHASPFDTDGPQARAARRRLSVCSGARPVWTLCLRLAADQKPLLDPRAETPAANQPEEIEWLVPAHANGEEVAVEPERVPRIDGVLAPEPQARGHEVAEGVEVSVERVGGSGYGREMARGGVRRGGRWGWGWTRRMSESRGDMIWY